MYRNPYGVSHYVVDPNQYWQYVQYNYPVQAYRSEEERAGISPAAVNLMNEFRTLWEQHVFWTRIFVVSAASSLGDLDMVTKRLLRNAPDMAAVFKRYYGEAIGAQFEKLFTEHLTVAAEIVKASKAGKKKEAAEAEKRWYANADAITTFLSQINPNWPKDALKKSFDEHLDITKNQAVFYLNKQYAKDIAETDMNEKHVLGIADVLTSGIVKQFPDQFRG